MKKSFWVLIVAVLAFALVLTACNNGTDNDVNITSVSLSESVKSLVVDETFTLTATVVASPNTANNKKVKWSSLDNSVATVNASGKVTAKGLGATVITAASAVDSSKTAQCLISVESTQSAAIITSVTLSESTKSLVVDETFILTATVVALPDTADNRKMEWYSLNDSVATVDANGEVTAKSLGSTVITAISAVDASKLDQCLIMVELAQPPATITSVTLSESTKSLVIDETFTLTATVVASPDTSNNRKVDWLSLDNSVATVDANGKVTAKSLGTAIITATSAVDSSKTAQCQITVEKPLTVVFHYNNGDDNTTATLLPNQQLSEPAEPLKEGFLFEGWYLEDNSDGTKIDFPYIPYADETHLFANWTILRITVNAVSANDAMGLVSGGGTFDYGTLVELTATPNAGYGFDGWYVETVRVSQNAAYSFEATEDKTVEARFEVKSFALSVATENSLYGTVSGDGTFNFNSSVTVTATPKTGFDFDGWYQGDSLVSESRSYTFTMPANTLLLTAKWKDLICTVTVVAGGAAGTGNVSGGGQVKYNNSVTVTAAIDEGQIFTGWFNGFSLYSKSLAYTFNVTSNITLTARWNVIQQINSASEFKNMDLNQSYILMQNISLSSWTPLREFTGLFDGNGKTIHVQSFAYTGSGSGGIFSGMSNATVKNLNITHDFINLSVDTGGSSFGCLARYLTDTKIVNCHINAGVSSPSSINLSAGSTLYAGGFSSTSTRVHFLGCSVNLVINATSTSYMYGSSNDVCLGGFTAFSYGNTFENCIAKVKLKAESALSVNREVCAGGFVGIFYSSSKIINSYSSGTVTLAGALKAGDSTLTGYAGGLAGSDHDSSLIENSFSTCVVTANASYTENHSSPLAGSLFSAVNNYQIYEGGDYGTVKTVGEINNRNFYIDVLGWDEEIWDFSDLSDTKFPILKS